MNKQSRRGSLFLLLAMVIIVLGLFATRLIPSKNIQNKRMKANNLRSCIGEIREAILLKRLASPTYNPQMRDPASIAKVLEDLANENYLRRESLKDATVPSYLWDENDGTYWKSVNNIASNCSFEITESTKIASWTIVPGSNVATNSNYLFNSSIDDFPTENKLGVSFRASGSVLEIFQ